MHLPGLFPAHTSCPMQEGSEPQRLWLWQQVEWDCLGLTWLRAVLPALSWLWSGMSAKDIWAPLHYGDSLTWLLSLGLFSSMSNQFIFKLPFLQILINEKNLSNHKRIQRNEGSVPEHRAQRSEERKRHTELRICLLIRTRNQAAVPPHSGPRSLSWSVLVRQVCKILVSILPWSG